MMHSVHSSVTLAPTSPCPYFYDPVPIFQNISFIYISTLLGWGGRNFLRHLCSVKPEGGVSESHVHRGSGLTF